ncbi:hypothetical protein D9M72_614390 [compost metagenome]
MNGSCWLGSSVIRYQLYSTPPIPKNTSRLLRPTMSDSQPPIGCSTIRKVSTPRLMSVPVMTSLPANALWIIFGPFTE